MNYNEIAKLVMSRLYATRQGGAGNPEDHMNLSTWEWPQGVAMYAMMKVYLKTRSQSDLEDIKVWYAQHIERGLPVRNINTTAPMLTMTMLYEETGDETYRPLIEDWANWVMTGLPRTEEGGFQHITT
ncbi:MAG: glycoside hydrolase family 105 protein, partial [Clostridiales bacterium]|nr:glycoside hydrolase family 105 protein [Clostridiales bacterium]